MAETTKRGRPAAKTTIDKIPIGDAVLEENTKTPRIVEKEKLSLDTIVYCRNGTSGELVYHSKRNHGYSIVWTEFGQEEPIELAELIQMRNSAPRFFTDNWILIEDDSVLRYLGVDKYYKNALNYENFDTLFREPPEVIIKKISVMSKGLRATVSEIAREKIRSGEFDSVKRIKAMEDALGIELAV